MKKIFSILTIACLILLLCGCKKEMDLSMNNYLKVSEKYKLLISNTEEVKKGLTDTYNNNKEANEAAGIVLEDVLNLYKEYYVASGTDYDVMYIESSSDENSKKIYELAIPKKENLTDIKTYETNTYDNYEEYLVIADGKYDYAIKYGNTIINFYGNVEREDEIKKIKAEFGL